MAVLFMLKSKDTQLELVGKIAAYQSMQQQQQQLSQAKLTNTLSRQVLYLCVFVCCLPWLSEVTGISF